ncbi:ATP-binding cassette domain-containing protein [Aeromonas encheleia]|uniref:ATP-binding cassette domain-containing protein n=1 Tax=Aeromonas encheleia TaxID=73010 RepID=A0AAE9SAS2_9GAMM|nr:ATP-binding cassette domain-containing protein [Aeromonas encheleia]USV56048.1 ATP-binding cassette domain-containing protein [Aeromonas encheleia]
MLSFDNVTIEAARYNWLGRRRWQPLLCDIKLQLAPGEIVALVGGSGEGKSLLLQSALSLLPDNLRMSGTIALDGAPLCDEGRARLRGHTLCHVPQGVSALNPLLTVERQLGRAARLSGQSGSHERLCQQLQRYQLPPATLVHYPRQLSGGMAKRILACAAALGGARFILADEITAWLDEGLACLLLGQLRELARQGSGILWVTHDLALAARFADRIVALHQGRVSDSLSSQQLRQGQGSPMLRAHWQALPEFNSLFCTPEASR